MDTIEVLWQILYHQNMKILADQYLYKLDEMLPESCDLQLYNPANGLPENVLSFDALLIRTVTPINSSTIPKTGNLKFIGTASAGFDHMDLTYLKRLGIHYGNSKGCNAHSVAEYIISSLFRWQDIRNKNIAKKTIGIVGCGATGSAVESLLKKLKLSYVLYDPPKAEREPGFQTCTLDELLKCDILTFHTPLNNMGRHSTHHLCNETWFRSDFDLIINAARGGVVDEYALLKAFHSNSVSDMIVDVWEGEPLFSDEVARHSFIATPHIAGYSKEAKWTATEMIVKQMCKILNIPFSPQKNPGVGKISPPEPDLTLSELLWKYQKIDEYDRNLRSYIGMDKQKKARCFAKLRSETELRTELKSLAQQWSKQFTPEFSRLFEE